METAKVYFNQKLYDALRGKIANYDENIGRRVVDAVHSAIVDARNAGDEEIVPGASLSSGLFAEEADGLAIAESLEKLLRISFPRGRGAVAFRVLYRDPAGGDYTERTVLDLAVETYELAVKRK